MQYHNFHHTKPELGKLIVWLNCQLKEVFGYYRGNLYFVEINDGRKGYLPKYWREPTDIEHNQFILIPDPPIVKKRARPPKT